MNAQSAWKIKRPEKDGIKKNSKNFYGIGIGLASQCQKQKQTDMKSVLTMMMIAIMGFATRSSLYVTGTVYDEAGKTLPGVNVVIKGTTTGVTSDINGFYSISVASEKSILVFTSVGMATQEIRVGTKKVIDVFMTVSEQELQEVVVVGYGAEKESHNKSWFQTHDRSAKMMSTGAVSRGMASPSMMMESDVDFNTEEYSTIQENEFRKALDKPLSTFSIDVDAASYSNMRRFINNGQLPPKDAVRIEEMINYFGYNYEQPTGDDPFSINTEVTTSPWNEKHLLVQVGLQGKKLAMENLPPSNIVFLLDVSGSMSSPNKLPLLKASLKMLANELRPQDKVSIVVYAGAAGLVLEPTEGNNKQKIMEALDRLEAGGSTAGGAGIRLAYETAKKNFVKSGNNRVILATDGDFNVGESSNAGMERLIEEKRNEGVFLTVLGFGMGNYKDSKMEILADKGNGNYAYIDTMKEAKKVLVNEFGGTLFTIAKDVKIQVEFNPAHVQAYRLIGYENRLLKDEDFNDDKKDAGELGSGHTVTALYEIIPTGVESEFVKDIDPLKYQENKNTGNANSNELLTVKFRYKTPDGDTSKLISKTVKKGVKNASENLNWASAVAGYGMLLRNSEFKGDLTFDKVLVIAKGAKGADEFGYRAEFIQLVELAKGMSL
jgi:Ca-activated chloride channel family protein